MGKPTGFLEVKRQQLWQREVSSRVRDHREFELPWPVAVLSDQAARCMDCGVPTCHGTGGCPLGNLIPDWNEAVRRGDWEQALRELHRTNNFPDITGRICPAPCEDVCVLGLIDQPVSIKAIEKSIIDRAFAEGRVRPRPAQSHSGKRVAIVGSGPAGLTAAQRLARWGHEVSVFEKQDRLGGLLTYGIPNFKLEPEVVQRRVEQMEAEGVRFHTNTAVGHTISIAELRRTHHAVLLACGAEYARTLPTEMPGSDLHGIHLAMEYLVQQNRRNYGDTILQEEAILATDKRVVILGGGDTGADCLGTAHRHRAAEVFQYEILPQPLRPKQGASHEEGGKREWSVLTKGFRGENGHIRSLDAVRVEWIPAAGNGQTPHMRELPGTEFSQEVDLVLLAMGFLGPVHKGLLENLGLRFTERGTVARDSSYRTSEPHVFAAGDCTRGASLAVWAIQEGRDAAASIHADLMRGHMTASSRPPKVDRRDLSTDSKGFEKGRA